MPLFDDRSAEVVQLSSALYANKLFADGVGMRPEAFRKMSELINNYRQSSDYMVSLIANELKPDEGTGVQFSDYNRQAIASTQMSLMEEIRRRGKFTNIVHQEAPKKLVWYTKDPTASMDLAGTMNMLTGQIQQDARNIFTSSQLIDISKMVAEWLSLVEILIACAADAEKNLTTLVAEINAQRQAMWKLVGQIIGTVLTFAAPPPFGQIIGGVVKAVLTADKWTDVLTQSASSTFSATYKGSQEQWTLDSKTNTWGPSEQTVYNAVSVTKAPGTQKTLADYKDVPGVIGSVPAIFGKPAQDKFKKINEKTLIHLTDMPDPPKKQSEGAAKVIRQEIGEKLKAIVAAIRDDVDDFMGTVTGPAALIHASFKYQESHLLGRLKTERSKTEFLKTCVVRGCHLYLNTLAHNIMETLAAEAKPKFNSTDVDKEKVTNCFEIIFWAGYLGSSAMNESKHKKPEVVGTEEYWARRYGTIKKLVWAARVEDKLNALGITKKFAADGKIFKSRSAAYQTAIDTWQTPKPNVPFTPVPYQDGGSDISKGRLAAWAVEYNKRPPTEIMAAILGG